MTIYLCGSIKLNTADFTLLNNGVFINEVTKEIFQLSDDETSICYESGTDRITNFTGGDQMQELQIIAEIVK